MNAAMTTYEDQAINYRVKSRNFVSPPLTQRSSRPTHGRRRGKTPTSFNGIHRRRNKRTGW